METLEKVRNFLNNLTQEQFDKEWEKVQDVGVSGPSLTEYSIYLEENVKSSPNSLIKSNLLNQTFSVSGENNYSFAA